MSKQTINIGASPNDGTGTPLRTSFDYTNQNFTEIYTALGGGVALPGATTQVIFNDGGTNLAGDAGLVYNKTTDALTVAGLVTAGSATITGALTVDTTTLVVNAAGYTDKVGIGTATPGYDLEIAGAVRSSLAIRGNFAGGTDIAHLRFLNANGSIVGDIFSQNTNGGASDSAYLSFNTTSSGTSAERYRIDATGISTWSVAGTTAMTLNSTSLTVSATATTPLDLTNAAVTTERQIKITNSSVTAFLGVEPAAGGRFLGSAANNAYFGTNVAYGLEFATNNEVRMTLNTTGNLAFRNGFGIDFAAKTPDGSGTVGSEVLNDYEEGTFTPTIVGTAVTGGATYAISVGIYTKIGRTVQFQLDVSYSAGTGSGNLRVSNLPFVNGGYLYPVTVYPISIGMTALYYGAGILSNGTSYIDLQQLPTGGGGDLSVPYDVAGRIIITGTYNV